MQNGFKSILDKYKVSNSSLSIYGSLSIGCRSVLVLSIFDARVYGLWKTGVDNDAVLMSGFSASYKIGLALGTPVVGVLLKLVPYVQGAAEQADSVLSQLRFQSSALCGFMFVIPFFLYIFVVRKNEKNLPMMRAEIEARKKDLENGN